MAADGAESRPLAVCGAVQDQYRLELEAELSEAQGRYKLAVLLAATLAVALYFLAGQAVLEWLLPVSLGGGGGSVRYPAGGGPAVVIDNSKGGVR